MTDGEPPEGEATDTDTGPSDEDLPEGWTVWNDEPGGRRILAYRPDVFDTEQFPPACLPTLYVAAGAPNRPAAEAELGTTDVWRVEFFLEPDVTLVPARTHDTREAALDDARDLADQFTRGDLEYRKAYQVPRDEYLDELDELTERKD
jgi:hypothetical protein